MPPFNQSPTSGPQATIEKEKFDITTFDPSKYERIEDMPEEARGYFMPMPKHEGSGFKVNKKFYSERNKKFIAGSWKFEEGQENDLALDIVSKAVLPEYHGGQEVAVFFNKKTGEFCMYQKRRDEKNENFMWIEEDDGIYSVFEHPEDHYGEDLDQVLVTLINEIEGFSRKNEILSEVLKDVDNDTMDKWQGNERDRKISVLHYYKWIIDGLKCFLIESRKRAALRKEDLENLISVFEHEGCQYTVASGLKRRNDSRYYVAHSIDLTTQDGKKYYAELETTPYGLKISQVYMHPGDQGGLYGEVEINLVSGIRQFFDNKINSRYDALRIPSPHFKSTNDLDLANFDEELYSKIALVLSKQEEYSRKRFFPEDGSSLK